MRKLKRNIMYTFITGAVVLGINQFDEKRREIKKEKLKNLIFRNYDPSKPEFNRFLEWTCLADTNDDEYLSESEEICAKISMGIPYNKKTYKPTLEQLEKAYDYYTSRHSRYKVRKDMYDDYLNRW